MRSGERGFSYLLLLFMLAAMGAGLAAMGQQWTVAQQREQEAELLFRGREFSRALAHYRDSTPAGQAAAPVTLAELLVDTRHATPRHHLRRLYTDPFTTQPDWVLQRDAAGRILALHSRSTRPALKRLPPAALREGAPSERQTVGDWLFLPAGTAVPTPASQASLPPSPLPRSPR
jgi:type II secretory pathway pseudopilin PulG